jgi:hypothetical protein
MHYEEQRTRIRSVAAEVCRMGFRVVDYVLRRGDVLSENFHWHGHMPFPKQSNGSVTEPLNGFQIE